MRLLKIDSRGGLSLTKDLTEDIPKYAILSHTWGADEEEVAFNELRRESSKNKAGYAKIMFCAERAWKDGLQHIWVDTCCINKANYTELNQAITSMFRWYAEADRCYVFLSDVSARNHDKEGGTRPWEFAFRKSRWFTRGWTLQELLAPRRVEFFSRERELLGDRITLQQEIHEITGIPIAALHKAPLSDFSTSERMRWASGRTTNKVEDKAYCLLGIFNIYMPLLYGEGDNAFTRLETEIKNLGRTLREVDTDTRTYYLRAGYLDIERLSGKLLPMERCFINLGIVDHLYSWGENGVDFASEGRIKTSYHASKFSLGARLKVEAPPQVNQVTLQTLFEPRKLRPNGTTGRPRRVLIWGRAGIGKTTLCKKIVHDFINDRLWHKLYDRVYWIPLRRLKLMRNDPKNLGELIQKVCFRGDGRFPNEVLQNALEIHHDRSLLILDGLDEVSYAFARDSLMADYLNRLLEQANVIITSRPHQTNILDCMPPDLELETVGFSSNQVEEFLQSEVEMGTSEKIISEIRSFVRSHPIVQSLIRIPIQLDAICYAWNMTHFSRAVLSMTTLYQAITRQLWEKDTIRLGKSMNGEQFTWLQIQDCADIRPFVRTEANLLEELAFIGLHNETVEFAQKHVSKVVQGQVRIPNDLLVNSSLLRSSDKALNPADRTYHFIHLTFQEFLAAQYFVRHWIAHATIPLFNMGTTDVRSFGIIEQITPEDFLRSEKYNDRYNIFWRFVAGLMQIEGTECHLHRLFDVLEGEPLDLLGPAQQRLIIHCLSEVDSNNHGFRSRAEELENDYWKWAQFEFSIHSSTTLMQELECPDWIFRPWLEGSDEEKKRALLIIRDRLNVSPEILRKVILELRKPLNGEILKAAYQLLGKHCDQISGNDFFSIFLPRDVDLLLMALEALTRSGNLSKRTMKVVIALIQHESSRIRDCAVKALQWQTTLPGFAVEILIKMLRHKNWQVRSGAVRALRRPTGLSDTIASAVVPLLRDEKWRVRVGAARTLSKNPIPDLAVDLLISLLRDEDWQMRKGPVHVFNQRINLPGSAVEALIPLLRDKDMQVWSSTAHVLEWHVNLLGSAIKALIPLLMDKDEWVRRGVVCAFGGQSFLTTPTVEALTALSRDCNSWVRQHAVRVLQRRTILPGFTVNTQNRLLRQENRPVHSRAVRTLRRPTGLWDSDFNPGSETVTLQDSSVEALIALLRNEDWRVQISAVRALGEQSTSSGAALEILISLLQDKNLSGQAVQALQGNEKFYFLIPELNTSALQNLLLKWLWKSFRQAATWCMWDEAFSINIDGFLVRIPLEKGKRLSFEYAIRKASEGIGIPRHCT